MIWQSIKRLFAILLLVMGSSMALIVFNSQQIELRIFGGIIGVVSIALGISLLFGKSDR